MNKKIFYISLSVVFFACLFNVKGQSSITLNPGNVFTMNMGLNNVLYDGIEFTNITNDTLILHYKKILHDTASGSKFDICLSGECYNGVPDSATFLYNPTPPGQIGWMKMHFWAGNTIGTSKVKIYLYDPAFPNNGDTLTFILNATSLSNINNLSKENIIIYPNPVSQTLFFRKLPDSVRKILVFDLLGKHIKEYKNIATENYKIDVSEFFDGLYVFQFLDEESNFIFKEKLIIKNN